MHSLRRTISFAAASFAMISCARLPPESSAVLPKAGQLEQFHQVALSVSASEIEVHYAWGDESILTPLLLMAAPYVGLLPAVTDIVVEHEAGSSRDKAMKKRLQDTSRQRAIQDTMSRYMTEAVNAKAGFRLDPCQGRSPSQLAADGYDGFIDVRLNQIYFQREGTSEKLRMYVRGTGKLTKLAGGNVVWTREELIATDLSHTIGEYTAEDGRLFKEDFDGLLRKLSAYLTRDFAYAQ